MKAASVGSDRFQPTVFGTVRRYRAIVIAIASRLADQAGAGRRGHAAVAPIRAA